MPELIAKMSKFCSIVHYAWVCYTIILTIQQNYFQIYI